MGFLQRIREEGLDTNAVSPVSLFPAACFRNGGLSLSLPPMMTQAHLAALNLTTQTVIIIAMIRLVASTSISYVQTQVWARDVVYCVDCSPTEVLKTSSDVQSSWQAAMG